MRGLPPSTRVFVSLAVVTVVGVAYVELLGAWLSPTVHAALLAVLGIWFLVDASAEDRSPRVRTGYALVGGAVIGFLLFERLGPFVLVFLAFTALPALAIWRLRLAESGSRWRLAPETRLAVAALLLVSGVFLVGYDVTGPGVTFEDVETAEGEKVIDYWNEYSENATRVEFELDDTHVRNEFGLARTVDVPRYEVCVTGDDADVVQHVEKRPYRSETLTDGVLEGNGEGTFGLRVWVTVRGEAGDSVSLWIERGSGCDVEHDRLTLRYWRTDGPGQGS